MVIDRGISNERTERSSTKNEEKRADDRTLWNTMGSGRDVEVRPFTFTRKFRPER